jgi:tRNA pseudouridine55 synthase
MADEKKSFFEEGQVLLFNKPVYWTSFDLVNKVRNLIRNAFKIKKIKVGHAGTLDPLASGLMIICTGKSTKKIDEFRDLNYTIV